MKPNQYTEYAKVFDYFSDPAMFPLLEQFIDIVAFYLPPNSKVVDVGAGTGLYGELLLQRASRTQLTILEPSPDMMVFAQKRLADRAQYCTKAITAALPELSAQDAFIFQRSLYAIYESEAQCQKLLEDINKKLLPGGYVFIFETDQKMDLEGLKNLVAGFKENSVSAKAEFLANWQVIEGMVTEVNEAMDAGKLHIFTAPELDKLLKRAGFSKVLVRDFTYVYRKEVEWRGFRWLLKLLGIFIYR